VSEHDKLVTISVANRREALYYEATSPINCIFKLSFAQGFPLVTENTDFVFQLRPRQCASCGSHQVRRSQRRGLGEYILAIILLRPFRCLDCHERHHGFAFRRFTPQTDGQSGSMKHSAA